MLVSIFLVHSAWRIIAHEWLNNINKIKICCVRKMIWYDKCTTYFCLAISRSFGLVIFISNKSYDTSSFSLLLVNIYNMLCKRSINHQQVFLLIPISSLDTSVVIHRSIKVFFWVSTTFHVRSQVSLQVLIVCTLILSDFFYHVYMWIDFDVNWRCS